VTKYTLLTENGEVLHTQKEGSTLPNMIPPTLRLYLNLLAPEFGI